MREIKVWKCDRCENMYWTKEGADGCVHERESIEIDVFQCEYCGRFHECEIVVAHCERVCEQEKEKE